jgi:hypothetical protein
VVINAVSKSGGSNYHGSIYGYVRNSALNSNDWIDNYFNNARAGTYNYFPGANVGGPVKIPGTGFNRARKMTFFTAGEVYDQRNLYGNTATLSFIPTARMLSGDLSGASIGAALNLPATASAAMCPTPYGCVGLNNFGAAYSPASTQVDVQGHNIINGQIPFADFDPNVSAYTQFYPKINRVPQPQGNPPDCTNAANLVNQVTNESLLGPGQLCSDNINYDVNIFAQHNGFQYHARVDQNFTDATKLYVTYDYELVSDQSPVTNTYYAGLVCEHYSVARRGVDACPLAPLERQQHTHIWPHSDQRTHFRGVYFFSPAQLQNTKTLQDSNTGFVGPRYYTNGDTELPQIINYQGGVPDFAMSYFDPVRGAPKRKYSVNGADNLTKQLRRHSLKVGFYAEQSANNEYVQGYNDPQGQFNYNQYNSCNVYSTSNSKSALKSGLGNSVGNFLNGCGGFTQVNKFQSGDMKYDTIDSYVTDDWQATKKLTLTFGIRFDHLGPWVDSHGNGLAVWEPEKIQQNVVYNLNPNDPTTWPGIAWHNGKGTHAGLQPSSFRKPQQSIVLLPARRPCVRYVWERQNYFSRRLGRLSLSRLLLHFGWPAADIARRLGLYHTRKLWLHARSNRQLGGHQCRPAHGNSRAWSVCESARPNLWRLHWHSVHDRAADKNDNEQPVTYNYNFTVDQRLGHGSLLEMSYVGNQTQHSLTGGSGVAIPTGHFQTKMRFS